MSAIRELLEEMKALREAATEKKKCPSCHGYRANLEPFTCSKCNDSGLDPENWRRTLEYMRDSIPNQARMEAALLVAVEALSKCECTLSRVPQRGILECNNCVTLREIQAALKGEPK